MQGHKIIIIKIYIVVSIAYIGLDSILHSYKINHLGLVYAQRKSETTPPYSPISADDLVIRISSVGD